MVQVDVSNILMKEVIRVCESHPIYKSLDLDSKRAYVNEVLKDFVKLNGDFTTKAFNNAVDRLLIENHIQTKDNENGFTQSETQN